jgi:inorganic pyrophosphatase
MNQKVQVYVEIEKDSNVKYEMNKSTNELEIDRILPYPYFFPYSYGFIPNTLAMDNDELDVLIISDEKLKNDNFYNVFIIGALIMRDEKGLDEKLLCVLEEDYKIVNDLEKLSNEIKENLHWFFSNYKNKTPNKWSQVYGFESKDKAIDIYNSYKIKHDKDTEEVEEYF